MESRHVLVCVFIRFQWAMSMFSKRQSIISLRVSVNLHFAKLGCNSIAPGDFRYSNVL